MSKLHSSVHDHIVREFASTELELDETPISIESNRSVSSTTNPWVPGFRCASWRRLPLTKLGLSPARCGPESKGSATLGRQTKRPHEFASRICCRAHPQFAGKALIWWGAPDQDHGGATLEGADVMPFWHGALLVGMGMGMGKRTSPKAASHLAQAIFAQGAATSVLAAQSPDSRGATIKAVLVGTLG